MRDKIEKIISEGDLRRLESIVRSAGELAEAAELFKGAKHNYLLEEALSKFQKSINGGE